MWVSPYHMLLTLNSSVKLGAKPWLHQAQVKQAPDLLLTIQATVSSETTAQPPEGSCEPLQTVGSSSEGEHRKTRARLHQSKENPLAAIQVDFFFS